MAALHIVPTFTFEFGIVDCSYCRFLFKLPTGHTRHGPLQELTDRIFDQR